MEKLGKIINPKLFVQIGTNNGKDNFRLLVAKYKPKKVVLIEPNINLIPEIEKNYSQLKKYMEIIIINKAIFEKNDQLISLFIPAKDGIYGKSGVQPERKEGNYIYNNKHFSILPMNDWGDKKNMIEIKSKTITFNQLITNLNISNIDYLQIDTEGYDCEIIKSINLEKINIKFLRYEKWNFDINCFDKYHKDNKHKYGVNGMNTIKELLIKNNYELIDIKDKDGNDILAIKK
jgi:FkbM family methyltransferase